MRSAHPQSEGNFHPELEKMISTEQSQDRDGKIVSITGRSTLNNLIVLNNLLRETKASSTLEIGLAFGGSALVFAKNHSDSNGEVNAHVAIDPFQDHVNFAGLAALERAGLNEFVRHIFDFSDRALPALLAEGRRFQLIYIDGSHLFEDVFLDCHYAAQLLDTDGIMLIDDSSDEHVAKVIRFLRRNMQHLLSEIDLASYRTDGGKSLRYRLGKAIGRTQLTGFRKTGEGRRSYDSKLYSF